MTIAKKFVNPGEIFVFLQLHTEQYDFSTK